MLTDDGLSIPCIAEFISRWIARNDESFERGTVVSEAVIAAGGGWKIEDRAVMKILKFWEEPRIWDFLASIAGFLQAQ